MATTNNLAKMICEMTYKDLMTFASELADANKNKEVRPKLETPEEFASLIFDWADATVNYSS